MPPLADSVMDNAYSSDGGHDVKLSGEPSYAWQGGTEYAPSALDLYVIIALYLYVYHLLHVHSELVGNVTSTLH